MRVEGDGWRVVSARVGLRQQIRDIWTYREFLVLSVKTQLRVKYKNSALGFLWSMLNPALYLVVFYIVFQLILENGIPSFPIFLLSGLLVWNLFSASIAGATGSIVGGGPIVKKVVLPPRDPAARRRSAPGSCTSSCRASCCVLALVVFRYSVATGSYLPLIVPALLSILLLAGRARRSSSARSTSASATPSTWSSWRCSRGSG